MATFEGWLTGIVLMVLFVSIFGVAIVGEMNDLHSENQSLEGLGTDELITSFDTFQETSSSRISDGDISITDLGGILFIDSWTILIGAFDFMLSFLFGGWIETIVSDYLKLSGTVSLLLRGLWVITLIFIVLGVIFKRKT